MTQRVTRRFSVLAAAAIMLATFAAVSVAWAQQQNVRVRGEIVRADGNTIVVKSRDGSELTINLTDNARVSGVVPAQLSDIKAGTYIGASALPQADGSQRALHIHIFPEALRGVAEGHFPYDLQPGSTMTNATVAEVVGAADGQTLNVKYKGEEKKIVIPAGTPIVTYAPGTKDELKPGAKIIIMAAQKQPDGTLQAGSVNVGRNGMTPPM